MTTTWKPCPGFEGVYEVSDSGDVKRVLGGPGRVVGRVLRGKLDKDGYHSVLLMHEGVKVHARVHRLVCWAFHGPPPADKPWALHRNGDNRDNRPENLYWGDAVENQRDAVKHGTHPGSVKTKCLRGHPYTPENTYLDAKGKRSCITCRYAAAKRYRDSTEAPPTGDDRHGTTTGYALGCRCDPCRKARSAYKRGWLERRRTRNEE